MRILGLGLIGFLCIAQSPEASIEGRLINAITGAPIRKARLILTALGADRLTRTGMSDVNGRYMLSGLPPGGYRLSVQREGLLPATFGATGPNRPGKVLVLSSGQKQTEVNFSLKPPAVISGRVLDEDAEPVAGVSVQALHEDFSQAGHQYLPVGNAVTNDIGEFRLFGLPPGKFYVMSMQGRAASGAPISSAVYSSVFYPAAADLVSAAALTVGAGGEARDIDLHVMKSSAVTVRGSIANIPAGAERSLQVQMWRKDRARVNFGSRSSGGFNATAGQFEFQSLTPGPYTISAWIQDKEQFLYARQDVEVGAIDVKDVHLALGGGMEIPGTIKLDGGAPVDGRMWRVWLSRAEYGGPAPSVTTGADYSFVLKNVTPDAAWTVGIAPVPAGGYIESIVLGEKPAEKDGLMRPLNITADSKGPLNIVIGMHGGSVEGVVRTTRESPQPRESATVLLIPSREYRSVSSYFKTVISGSDGHYEIKGIAPGSYRLLALDDMEPGAYLNAEFVKRLENRGKEINVARDGKKAEDLTVEPLP